jgi:predicted secreted protein
MEFSTYMNTKIDKSLINTESLEVYVISMNENVNVGLTWSLKSYEGRSLVIQLKFNNSQDISSSFSYDKLVIHFKIVKNRFIS